MSACFAALLRKARIAIAELRSLLAGLGLEDVKTYAPRRAPPCERL